MGDVVADLAVAVLVGDGDGAGLGADQCRRLVRADDRGQDQDVVAGAQPSVPTPVATEGGAHDLPGSRALTTLWTWT